MLAVENGDVGSGKNVFSTEFARTFDGEVLSNYHIRIPNFQKFDMRKFLAENVDRGQLIIIDEAYLEADNRQSMSIQNILESYLVFQHRKRHTDMIYIVQDLDSIDKRIRRRCDFIISCYNNDYRQRFEYTIFDLVRGGKRKMFIRKEVAAKTIYPLFDTFEIVNNRKFTAMLNNYAASEDPDGETNKQAIPCLKWLTEQKFSITDENIRHYCNIHNLPKNRDFTSLLKTKIKLL